MIVVDTNVLAYLYLPTEFTEQAETLLKMEPEWMAPVLWRSEFRNVLALYVRKKMLTFDQAYNIQTDAEVLLANREYEVPSYDVLRLIQNSNCSSYDCEFVALANKLRTKLITVDKKILKEFPDVAISLSASIPNTH